MEDIVQKIQELGWELPQPSTPAGVYQPVVENNGLLYVSGQLPKREGVLIHPGKLGAGVTVEQGSEAAGAALLCGLAAIRAYTGSLNDIALLQLRGFVNAVPEFTQHPAVIDGASTLAVSIFGTNGKHARMAVGVAGLPSDSCVEIELLCRKVT